MKFSRGIIIFIFVFLFLTKISNPVFAETSSLQNSNSASYFDIFYDLIKKLLTFSTDDLNSETTTSSSVGGGGAGASRSWDPLPNIDGNTLEQNKALAEQILANSNIDLNCYTDSCGHSSAEVISSLKNGQAPVICSGGCSNCAAGGPSGSTTMNPKVLQGILEVGKTDSICITALSNGVHSVGSTHYDGNAVDIDAGGKSAGDLQRIRNQLQSYCGWAICEPPGGGSDPSCSTASHIHWTCAPGGD